MSKKVNLVKRVSLAGGLIGAIGTNPQKALQAAIDKENQNGWNAIHVEPHRTHNALVMAIQLAVLILTLGIWTWGGGYMILFEQEAP